jgi:hypothetical protein
MHNGQKVVDVHGHMTTPAPFRQFLAETVAQNTPGRKLDMTDEQSCTSGRAGGLICEPLKAVWPAFAGISYLNMFS